ncbi:Sodium/hydrogen exchanger family protein [Rhodopirellula islandica]|uniref:Sodium/hydrogen exchanger family protein n=1 Tax=Rhodopirellula islandica TaxID=595434 RepID=A0A0J1BEY4_RHOIS|nr:sodium:proton antiporter [Rhodopirellula islandica]KLU05061.1 Sodium/hydrogen exchanger family protein [Rhodopirellula islandica]
MDFLLYLALVPTLGVTAQWLAWRTKLPSILLLLLFGICLGHFVVQPDALLANLTGGDETAGPNLLFPLVSLSVAVIMFEGGLTLKLSELRESGSSSLRLCTVGAALAFIGNTLAIHWILGFDWHLSFLLGAILVVTGPTVIGPLLRQVKPSRRVASTLKWEGIVIDPIGAVLAVLVFEEVVLAQSAPHWSGALQSLVLTSAIGVGLGVAGGALLTQALRRYWVPDHLHGVAALSLALLLFALSNMMAHESGLIAVTVLGIWLTNQKHFDVEHIIELKENLRTLLIGCLFIVLGSRVNLTDLATIGMPGIGLILALIFIVRPLSVYLSLLRSPLNYREQTFIAGLAPRGIVAAAVSSVFALSMESRTDLNIPGSEQLATVTFLVIIGTVAVYGIAASPLARLLKLAEETSRGVLIAGADAWVRDFATELNAAGIPVLLVDTNYNKISQARIAGLRGECANILNEHAREDLDLSGIGRLLAMTPNDEVNSLALRECRAMFESSRLYQLTFKTKNAAGRRGLTKNLMGRELFGEGLTFTRLSEMHAAGASLKTTKLTESYSFADFQETYGEVTTVLCAITAEGGLNINTVDAPLVPVAGQTILALVSSTPVPEKHAVKASKKRSDASNDGAADADTSRERAKEAGNEEPTS